MKTKTVGCDEKVFCVDCKHFKSGFGMIRDECEAEGNKRYKPNWESNYYYPIRHPKRINKHNDCRWYEEKSLTVSDIKKVAKKCRRLSKNK
jgi:hypothetical protein